MKYCSTCQNSYSDESLEFCRKDGTPLVSNSPGSDSSTTVSLSDMPTSHNLLTRHVQTGIPSIETGAASIQTSTPSIAVLPFVNMSADPENEYFCDGLAEELINALTKLERLHVVARSSAFSFKNKEVDVREVGRKLSVVNVLEGSVRRAGDRLRITAQLINARDGYHLWSERYDRQITDVFAIQDQISLAIVDELKIKLLGNERANLLNRYRYNLEAYNLYLKGRYHWNQRPQGLKKAIEYFQQAIDQDPNYALAYAGLADCYVTLSSWENGILSPLEAIPKAKAAAKKALELDDSLSEAYASLAYARMHCDWEWAVVESGYKHAINLNPNYATAHHWYSHFLMARGHTEESFAESKRCLELDPLDLIINVHLAWHYQFAREYDRAIEQCLKTKELYPGSFWPSFFLALAYEQKEMYGEALTEFEKAIKMSGNTTFTSAGLGHLYAVSGKKAEAQKVIGELIELSSKRYVTAYDIAIIYTGLGEKDQAFEWLDKAFQERSGWLAYLKVEPRMNKLGSDSRFEDLLRRVGLNP